jgi:hypothetical protein
MVHLDRLEQELLELGVDEDVSECPSSPAFLLQLLMMLPRHSAAQKQIETELPDHAHRIVQHTQAKGSQ